MTGSPSPARDLALRLLRRQGASDDSGSDVIAAAANRVLRHIRADLVKRFGDEGFRALVRRAIDRIRPSYPALTGVTPRREEGGGGDGVVSLDALFEHLERQDPGECMDTCLAVIAAMITLLGRLVGDDLTIRLIARDSPDSSSGDLCSTVQ